MNCEITFSQLEMLEKPKVIDIRSPEQFAHGSYPRAENIPMEMLKPEDDRQPVFLLCQSGIISLELAEKWQEMGIPAVSIQGGYREYLRQTLARTVSDEAMCFERRKKAEHSALSLPTVKNCGRLLSRQSRNISSFLMETGLLSAFPAARILC